MLLAVAFERNYSSILSLFSCLEFLVFYFSKQIKTDLWFTKILGHVRRQSWAKNVLSAMWVTKWDCFFLSVSMWYTVVIWHWQKIVCSILLSWVELSLMCETSFKNRQGKCFPRSGGERRFWAAFELRYSAPGGVILSKPQRREEYPGKMFPLRLGWAAENDMKMKIM